MSIAAASIPAVRDRARGWLQKGGILPPPLPIFSAPNASPDRVSARRLVVASLHNALKQQDYRHAAEYNAVLSQEAFQRANRVLQAWEAVRDPATGLIPHAVSPFYNQWDSEDVAADLFSHLLVASLYLDSADQAAWTQMIDTESEICGELACRIDLDSGKRVEEDLDTLIFGNSEYAKDGLLSVVERFGSGPWLDRVLEQMDAILNAAKVETRFGTIPSNGTETNGEMLQVLVRLFWITGEERYLQMAERIGEAYLFEVLPNNQGIPADYWDFQNQRPLHEDKRFRPLAESSSGLNPFRLADHGGEIIPGLTELYFLERMQVRPQAVQYREPLKQLLDRMLTVGRSGEGLWYNSLDVQTLEILDNSLADTWGYILNGYQTFDLANGTDDYRAEIERTMRAAASKHSIEWEGKLQDGYADAIESMLYLLPWFDISECHYWVDDEIEVLFLKQQPDGFVEGWYLDGNFVRTALLYGFYKTYGLFPSPWKETLQVGAALDNHTDSLYVYMATQKPWQGVLRFDSPRHQTIWNLPMEYPRLNGLPQWFIIEPGESYVVSNLNTGEQSVYSGDELIEGLPMELGLSDNVLRLSVTHVE